MITIKKRLLSIVVGGMCVVVNIAEAAPSANAGHLLRDFFQVDLQLQTAQSAGITNINTVGNVDDAARSLTNTYGDFYKLRSVNRLPTHDIFLSGLGDFR